MNIGSNFSVKKRNHGHWDVLVKNDRAFRVRGAPGKYVVFDERVSKEQNPYFKTVSSCMSYICDELMFELIKTESQEITLIKDWNLPD